MTTRRQELEVALSEMTDENFDPTLAVRVSIMTFDVALNVIQAVFDAPLLNICDKHGGEQVPGHSYCRLCPGVFLTADTELHRCQYQTYAQIRVGP